MTDDDFQRKAEFLLNQQAQSEARLGRLEDIVTRLADPSPPQVKKFEEKMTRLAQAEAHTAQKLSALNDIIRKMRDGDTAK